MMKYDEGNTGVNHWQPNKILGQITDLCMVYIVFADDLWIWNTKASVRDRHLNE